MTDREKVISTFEKIISVCKEDGCDFVDLTFEDAEQILALLKESVPQGVVDQIRWERDTALSQLEQIGKGLGSKMDDIVALLKEQEAVKPKSKVRHGANAQIQHFCGNCNSMLHGKPKFCSECGKGVLW